MDIKLRARLSAYSKVTSIGSSVDIPVPSASDAGTVLGVSESGDYKLFNRVSHEAIDSLFTGTIDRPRTVTKNEIDTLFETNEENPQAVSHAMIDSLFSR